jgi:hypothetical protein
MVVVHEITMQLCISAQVISVIDMHAISVLDRPGPCAGRRGCCPSVAKELHTVITWLDLSMRGCGPTVLCVSNDSDAMVKEVD